MPHVHDLYDFTVSGYIVHDNKILLLHHAKVGSWLTPGGHIELEEEPLESLWREMEEETGLSQKELTLVEVYGDHTYNPPSLDFHSFPLPFDFYVVNYYENDPSHQHIDLSYLLVSSSDAIRLEDGKAHDIGWFSSDQIDTMVADKKMFKEMGIRTKWALQLAQEWQEKQP